MKHEHTHGSTLECLTLSPTGLDERADLPLVVCLHGYGANMEDLTGLASAIDPVGYRYLFPNAPIAAFGDVDPTLRAWYERGGNESPAAVQEALAALGPFMQEACARWRAAPGRVVLLGFSQGGAMTLRYGLPRPEEIAGLAVLSGSLRRLEDLRADLPARRDQPVFIGHGTADSLVPVDDSRRLAAFLESVGYRPLFRTYPIDHQISPAEVRDLRDWLRKTLPPSPSPH